MALRGEGEWDSAKKKKERLVDTDNSMVTARGKGSWGEVEESKEGR